LRDWGGRYCGPGSQPEEARQDLSTSMARCSNTIHSRSFLSLQSVDECTTCYQF
jgi:hypothetical protein